MTIYKAIKKAKIRSKNNIFKTYYVFDNFCNANFKIKTKISKNDDLMATYENGEQIFFKYQSKDEKNENN